jgi:hypothetical protein
MLCCRAKNSTSFMLCSFLYFPPPRCCHRCTGRVGAQGREHPHPWRSSAVRLLPGAAHACCSTRCAARACAARSRQPRRWRLPRSSAAHKSHLATQSQAQGSNQGGGHADSSRYVDASSHLHVCFLRLTSRPPSPTVARDWLGGSWIVVGRAYAAGGFGGKIRHDQQEAFDKRQYCAGVAMADAAAAAAGAAARAIRLAEVAAASVDEAEGLLARSLSTLAAAFATCRTPIFAVCVAASSWTQFPAST